METLLTVLGALARRGKLVLVGGLVAGLALPDLAILLRGWLAEMVALLLYLAALRIGPGALPRGGALLRTLGLTLGLQLALPLALAGLAAGAGLLGTPAALALILMAAAPAISGSPHLAVMLGQPPEPALRLLIAGTLLVPLTILPILWLLPALGGALAVAQAAGRLLGVIGIAIVAAAVTRRWLLSAPSPRVIAALDGVAALALAFVVLGLMTALGPALRTAPDRVVGWLALAIAANFGLQWAARMALPRSEGAAAIVAGNRNIALYLVALPETVTDPLLIFIGCYQIPMYTTPLLLGPLYKR